MQAAKRLRHIDRARSDEVFVTYNHKRFSYIKANEDFQKLLFITKRIFLLIKTSPPFNFTLTRPKFLLKEALKNSSYLTEN